MKEQDAQRKDALIKQRRADTGLFESWKMEEFLHFQMSQQECVKRDLRVSDWPLHQRIASCTEEKDIRGKPKERERSSQMEEEILHVKKRCKFDSEAMRHKGQRPGPDHPLL